LDSRRPIQGYEGLEVFQRSMALVRPVHEAAKKLPGYEQFDLAQQMRRASKSIPTNIAEGFSKRSTAKDFKLYLGHALGSANEMLIHLRIAQELEYFTDGELKSLKDDYQVVCRQINKLMQVWS